MFQNPYKSQEIYQRKPQNIINLEEPSLEMTMGLISFMLKIACTLWKVMKNLIYTWSWSTQINKSK